MQASGSGSSVGSTSAVSGAAPDGQAITPCAAGISETTRSASPRNWPRKGVA